MRHDFHARYVYYELPEAVVRRLEPLFFPSDVDDLAAKRREAEDWFHELAREVGDGPGPDEIVDGGRQTARREEA